MDPIDLPQISSKAMLEKVRQALQADEELVWVGQPDPAVMARKQLVPIAAGLFVALAMVPVGLPMMFKQHETDDLLLKLLGAAIIVVPLVVNFGVLQWARFKALDTIYAITNKRALIFEPNRLFEFNVVLALDIRQLQNGKWDLILENMQLQGRNGPYQKQIGFLGIDDVEHVEAILKKTFEPVRVRHIPPKDGDNWQL